MIQDVIATFREHGPVVAAMGALFVIHVIFLLRECRRNDRLEQRVQHLEDEYRGESQRVISRCDEALRLTRRAIERSMGG